MNREDVKKPPQGRLGSELLFELAGPNGERWRIYLDGAFEGFPSGTSCANYALPMVNALIGEVRAQGVAFSTQ